MRWWFLSAIWMMGMDRIVSFNMTLEHNETGRFLYRAKSGDNRYCTVCVTGHSDEENEATQSPECVQKNFHIPMPNNSTSPFCKEEARGGVIPGCGPLPTPQGLSWVTKSGRPIQVNSTAYEVYFLICNSTGVPNRNGTRCGENLQWSVDPAGLECRYNHTEPTHESHNIKEEGFDCSDGCIIVICLILLVVVVVVIAIVFICFKRRRMTSICNRTLVRDSSIEMIAVERCETREKCSLLTSSHEESALNEKDEQQPNLAPG